MTLVSSIGIKVEITVGDERIGSIKVRVEGP